MWCEQLCLCLDGLKEELRSEMIKCCRLGGLNYNCCVYDKGDVCFFVFM